jgi:hypothetical protein
MHGVEHCKIINAKQAKTINSYKNTKLYSTHSYKMYTLL